MAQRSERLIPLPGVVRDGGYVPACIGFDVVIAAYLFIRFA